MREIEIISGTDIISVPVVGSYGTFDLPVVLVDGEECVAEEYFISDDGKPITPVCQSGGCDYCTGADGNLGCRFGEYANYRTAYVI